jgi:hypothetical protein
MIETRLPRRTKYLTGAERGLIDFLDALGRKSRGGRVSPKGK